MNYKEIILAITLIILSAVNADAIERESTICGFIKERFLFWVWSSAAPDPDPSRLEGIPNIVPTEFMTSDNRKLSGYKYLSHNESEEKVKPKGYVLMALGNAMLADRIIRDLEKFAAHNYDVYIYDYRGYGNSEGKRRINAIIEDYKEIAAHLNTMYDRKFLYGTSLGGAVMMNVVGSGVEFDAAVIDSSPSRFSPHGCPERIDPVKHLPDDSHNLLVITGDVDQVLGPEMTTELREEAKLRGAVTIAGRNFAHPFMDSLVGVRQYRMEIIMDFFFNDGWKR